MSTHDKARRAFLIQTAAGVGAAATATVLPPTDALAQAPAKETGAAASMPMSHATPASPGSAGSGAFFNLTDSETIAALTERIMPGAPGKPGAKDTGVLNYIDLALAGAYADEQPFYRRGIAQLDAYCMASYKKSFASLTEAQQDEVIGALQAGKATGFEWPTAQAFFTRIRQHTMEGMFADPVYGGNKDYGGWRLVGFPGAQEQYSPEEMRSSEKFTRRPIVGMKS